MPPALHVSAYCFTPLDDLSELRESLFEAARARALTGTVLLAREGINLALTGQAGSVRGWLQALRADARFAKLRTHESWCEAAPLKRLKVKIKDEIIRMNQPGVKPGAGRAPTVNAATLARWWAQGHDDEGRALALLDTRNTFEVEAGTFAGAVHWNLAKFGDFPQAFEAHRAALEDKTVVSFCTGGIRCEKAALWMRERGLERVLQLDGGILGYFAETAGAAPGWQGRCTVFDERGAVAPDATGLEAVEACKTC